MVQSDPRQRPRPFTFRPPRNNRMVTGVIKLISSFLMRRTLAVTRVEIVGDGMDRLRSFRGKRCMLMPSHSGGFEPYVILHLSKLLHDDYNYLAAAETFDRTLLFGWIMQRVGAYSIIRGTADRPSFQMTRQLLTAGKRWLVVFPEGQTVWQNDTVIPFQPGVLQLAFKAFETVAENDAQASLFCLPLSIKYIYLQDMTRERDKSLSRLEAGLLPDSESSTPADPYERLRRIAEAMLVANETRHNVVPDKNDSLDDRIQRMKEAVVRRIERQFDLTPRSDHSLLDRIRALFNIVDRIVYEDADGSRYEKKLHCERQQAARTLYDDLWRVLQLVAIYDGYVRESMTTERFMDVLGLLEMEVFAERRIWGPRKALVKLGQAVDLKDHLADYRRSKPEIVHRVTLELETSVRRMLGELAQ